MPEMLAKVEAAVVARKEWGLKYRIEVDGGINGATGPLAVQHGADTLVAGTSVFNAPEFSEAVKAVRGQ